MQILTLYFNELCLNNPPSGAALFKHIDDFIASIEAAIMLRPDCQLGFIEGDWRADCNGQPLAERIKQQLSNNRSRYQRLLPKIKNLHRNEIPLEREIQYQGTFAIGLTLADLAAHQCAHGWAISVANGSQWSEHQISAERYILSENGDMDAPDGCYIKHLSKSDHLDSWRTQLQDWGAVIAQSCTLDMLGSHPIVMYPAPKEHNPPHVHLLSSDSSYTLAKFRIADFVREEGKPNWDAAMKIWLKTYQTQLLKSWERCQRGGHPYKLEKDTKNT
jgi:Domain of unknown function (DUF4160)